MTNLYFSFLNFLFLFQGYFFKEDGQLEFDFLGKYGVDGINLLISMSSQVNNPYANNKKLVF